MRRAAAVLALAAVLLAVPASALYAETDPVVQATSKTFDDLIVKPDGAAIVEFYAPWCGHCKNLAPQYKTVAQKLKGIMTVAAVDCDDSANKKLCSQNGVKGFPTIKLFGPEKKKNPYTGQFYREATDYSGAGSAKGLMDAATALLTNEHITRIASVEEFEQFALSRPGVAKVLLFTAKKDTPLMYKGLSHQLHAGLAFAEVHEQVADVVAMHEVADFPTLMVFKADGSTETYSGDLKAPQVAEFLRAFASAPAEEEGAAGAGEASEEKKEGKQAKAPKVPEVKELSLEEAIELDGLDDMWLLALYSPGEGADCAEAISEYKQAVTDMQEVVKAALVAVKAEEVDQVSRYGVSATKLRSQGCALQLVLLPFGEDKESMDEYALYKGPLEGKALQKWVTDAIPSTFTTEVTSSSFQYFATMPPPGSESQRATVAANEPLIRLLLFTNKDEVPGVYKALATNMRSTRFGFGWVQSSLKQNAELMTQFSVSKVPRLVFIAYVPKDDPDEEGRMTLQPSMGEYRGVMKYSGMATFVQSLAKAFMPKQEDPEAAAAAALPEVTDDEGLDAACTSRGGVCVLCLLDPSAGAAHDAVKRRLADLAVAAGKRGQPFHFAWLDGRRFRRVAAAFGVRADDLPSVVALSAKRLRYATLPAATDTAGIATFLDGVLGGKVRTEVLQELPAIVEGGDDDATASPDAAADGSLEDAAAVEEEFDLSDILSEEVEAGDLASKTDRLKQVEEELKAEEAARQAAAKSKSKSKKKSKKGKSKSKAKTEL